MRSRTSGGGSAIVAEGVPPVARRRRRRGILDRDWLLALSLAFAVGVSVWFARSIRDYFAPPTSVIFVPSFTGQTETDAALQGSRYKLRTIVVARRNSDRYPKGIVMSQQPAAGSRVREGRQVSLVVSNGVVIFAMPDLRYSSLREAKLELSHRRLLLAKVVTIPNDDVPPEGIVAQDPLPEASVREGTHVTLTVSKGANAPSRAPNLENMPIDEARRVAAERKIHIGQIVWTPFGPSGPRRGMVVRQAPGPGAPLDAYTPVSLQVSAGPQQYGYLVRQVHATVTVPLRDDSVNIRLEIHDDTGHWNVYNGYAKGGEKLDFNLTAVGSAQILTFIDNELVNKTTLGVEPPRISNPGRTPAPKKTK